MQLRTLITLCVLFFASLCRAQTPPTHIDANGITVLQRVASGHKMAASFTTYALPTPDSSHFVQCTQSRVPCSLTSELHVSIDGKVAFIPKSAFADLGDVVSASFELSQGNAVLVIRGGDASEAYIARLIFSNAKLKERRLYSGEDTAYLLETTTY